MFQPVPNSAHVSIQAKLDGQDCINGLYFEKLVPGPVTQADLQGLIDGVLAWIIDNLTTVQVAALIHQKVIARALDVADSFVVEESGHSGTPGQRAGAIEPNNVAFSISFKTGLAGATNTGRNSFGGFLKTDITNSLINSVLAEGIRDNYALMIAPGYISAAWRWVIVSRKVAVPGDPGTPRAVTNVIYNDLVVDSQKTRLPNRGQ